MRGSRRGVTHTSLQNHRSAPKAPGVEESRTACGGQLAYVDMWLMHCLHKGVCDVPKRCHSERKP